MNFLYGGCGVLLVGVVELTGGGLIWVWEVFVSDLDEANQWDLYAYWTCGNICGSLAWRNGEWVRVFFGCGVEFGGVRGIRHVYGVEGRW